MGDYDGECYGGFQGGYLEFRQGSSDLAQDDLRDIDPLLCVPPFGQEVDVTSRAKRVMTSEELRYFMEIC